jgi:hypothetical protein
MVRRQVPPPRDRAALTRIKSGANAREEGPALDPGQFEARATGGHSAPNPKASTQETAMNVRKLRRKLSNHLYIAPIIAAALVAVLTAYAGVPHDGGQAVSAAPAAGMSIPF